MAWWDFFKIFNYAFTDDPLAERDRKDLSGAGISQPDAFELKPNSDGISGSRGSVQLRDTQDFVDLSTVTSRFHRYKEYERLRNMAEIENAMTVFADEACLAGDTLVCLPSQDGGWKTLEWLTDNLADKRFLVYSYDFAKEDFTLAWAHSPRLVKEEACVKVLLDDGTHFIATHDHRILMRDAKWAEAGDLQVGAALMPFYRISARQELTGLKVNQFPRIRTQQKGWIHERQFIDEWRSGKDLPQYKEANIICRMITEGLSVRQIHSLTKKDFKTNKSIINRAGFSNKELKWLSRHEDARIVVGIEPHEKIKVYDMTVEKHHNFCTNWGVAHNCQKDENGRVFNVVCKNKEITEELEYLLFHRRMLNLDQKKVWNRAKNLFINGDDFLELVINLENPKEGVINIVPLPADTMYRIETTKGRLVEFQQSKEGPDYDSLARVDITQATEADLEQSKAIRFAPDQIVHLRIGDDRKTFYPYGVSLVEAARGPAHQLRLMEDAMVVYRLTRAPERRVFYIDVQQLPPFKAEAFIERMKDQFKKKKVPANRGLEGASSVEERWHAPAADEDYWIPMRSNSNTRVETLPGAQNLGEIDDTVYFRNKLFIALNFPKNYFNNEDTSTTRVSLSSQDIKFARMIERLQSHIEDAFWSICDRHLKLRGYPEEMYEDLELKMTPPSDWRELTRMEVVSARINNAGQLKGSQLLSDFDILTKWLKYSEEEAKIMLARLKLQKLEDLKLQIIAQNPQLLGVGLPGPDEQTVSTEPSESNPNLGGAPEAPPPEMGGDMGGAPPEMGAAPGGPPPGAPPGQGPGVSLAEPSDEDISKYDLEIQDYAREQDDEEIDSSEGD